MAISQTHVRSISLPSRLQSPSTDFDSDLQNLKSLEVSASSEAIQFGLLRVAELYNCVDEVTQSQQHEKSMRVAELYNCVDEVTQSQQHEKSMEESLSCSVELLDACSAIREVIQMMKENIQTLQSAFRRRGTDSSVQNDITSYFCCRKRMNKSISKTLKTLKNSEKTMRSNGDCVFRDLTRISLAIFKSILIFLSSPSSRGLSLVSKVMNTRSGRENDGVASEVENVESGLMTLRELRSIDGTRVLDVHKRLQNLEAIVEGFDGGLERLFRQLVHIRVALLNNIYDH